MQRHAADDLLAAASADDVSATEAELRLLRDVLRLLPAGVTVQDAQGRLLMVNDAATVQLAVAAGGIGAPSKSMDQHLEAGRECLRTGQPLVTEDCFDDGKVRHSGPASRG